jgi:hypothetical protein
LLYQVYINDLILTLFQPYVLQLKDGELFYGRRRPRKVVLDEQAKTAILQQIHVDEIKGIKFRNFVC